MRYPAVFRRRDGGNLPALAAAAGGRGRCGGLCRGRGLGGQRPRLQDDSKKQRHQSQSGFHSSQSLSNLAAMRRLFPTPV